jgi:cytochrome P450
VTVLPAVPLPLARTDPLDPPDEYDRLRATGPVLRLRLADGRVGWLVVGHSEARAVLADRRFSARRTPGPVAVRQVDRRLVQQRARLGALPRMDPPEHTRYRRLLGGHFSRRRVAALVPRIEEITANHLDRVIEAGPPADLVADFAAPAATQVVCEVLGVPFAARRAIWRRTTAMLTVDTPHDRVLAELADALEFMRDTIQARRHDATGGVLGALAGDSGLSDDELAGLGNLLLTTGHEEPAAMIGLAVATLLAHPDQLERLRREPELVDSAVEELLRHQTILHFGVARTATERIVLGGREIRPGETVVVALSAANRDPDVHPAPHTLDLSRGADHLSFGHGIHQCLGQHLARAQLRATLTQLFTRLPALHPIVPVNRLPFRHDMFVYGVYELPVAWNTAGQVAPPTSRTACRS